MNTYEITYLSRSGKVLSSETKTGYSLRDLKEYAQRKVWANDEFYEAKVRRV